MKKRREEMGSSKVEEEMGNRERGICKGIVGRQLEERRERIKRKEE